ncbi:MAG: hypothetical protein IRY94_17250 [Rhodospirillaceae bacterium]|nr:hypothetical protein [Rhodospirillaceae bacterium]
MKGLFRFRFAAVAATLLALGGCAAWDSDPMSDTAGLPAAVPAPAPQLAAAAQAVPAAPVVPGRRVTYIVRRAPVLLGYAGGTCPWARAAQARGYRPGAALLAHLPPRALEHRGVYRLTAY